MDQLIRFRAYKYAQFLYRKKALETDPQEVKEFGDIRELEKSDLNTPLPEEGASFYGDMIRHYLFDVSERATLLLSLFPHLFPGTLEEYLSSSPISNIENPLRLAKSKSGRLLPTGETLLYILAGNDLEMRLKLLHLFDKNHPFHTHQLISLKKGDPNDPEISGILTPSTELIDMICRGEVRKPDLNPDFPAKLITTEMEWSDLIIPQHSEKQLEELEQWILFSETLRLDEQLGNKMKPGVRALFYGPPGTGKTLAATLIGKKTERDVYRIDLSSIVSKYIGETEKKLRKLFDQAEQKNWILFFDEADALFGKRTNVSDAHDRYANQEVSYLLQRVEYFDGIVILATNMRNNLDKAFTRRFQTMVHFPIPKAKERYELWKITLPEMFALEESVDIKKLAEEHELTGAHIVNIVSYCSLKVLAAGSTKLTHSLIRESISQELSKEGRTL